MGNKKTVMKWVMFSSFVVLVFGGLNYLMMGLLSFDLFAELFGGVNAIVSRVFYAIFGIAAVRLATIMIIRAFFGKQTKTTTPKRVTSTKSA